MTLHEGLRRVEHWAAGVWLLVVAAAHTDTGVAFPLFMALAVAMLALGGWWLARIGLSLAFARDVKESWRSRLWVPAALRASPANRPASSCGARASESRMRG